jgi:hypothetical protein
MRSCELCAVCCWPADDVGGGKLHIVLLPFRFPDRSGGVREGLDRERLPKSDRPASRGRACRLLRCIHVHASTGCASSRHTRVRSSAVTMSSPRRLLTFADRGSGKAARSSTAHSSQLCIGVGSTSPAGPDAAVQPRWSLSRRLPPRATAVTGFGSPRRWRRTSSSEVERPLANKRCGGLFSAAAATPQRSSSDSSQSEAVVATGCPV